MPVILAGIRTATVINVGVATLASYIAAGGLGEFIFGGISLNNTNMILAGAIPAALLAIIFDFLLSRVQNFNFKKVKTATTASAACCLFYCHPFILSPRLRRKADRRFYTGIYGQAGWQPWPAKQIRFKDTYHRDQRCGDV